MNKIDYKLFSTMVITCIMVNIMALVMRIGNYTDETTLKLFIVWCIPFSIWLISIVRLAYRMIKVW